MSGATQEIRGKQRSPPEGRSRCRHWRGWPVLAIVSIALASPSFFAASAEERERTLSPSQVRAPEQRIVNGLTTVDFPTTVALLSGGSSSGDGEPFCTGTLIGCQTVLTAAHCVCGDSAGVDGASCQPGGPKLTAASSVRVFAQSGGVFQVGSIDVPSHYEFGYEGDVAVLHLTSAVNGIAPSKINLQGTPAMGASGLIAGFGRSAGDASDAGIKRFGAVTVAPCTSVPEATHVCWEFDAPLGAPGEDSNTCYGDSGGPLFADPGAGMVVAGVTSGGPNSLCGTPDNPFDSDVFVERVWIQDRAGADLENESCGSLSQVGAPEVALLFGEGTLDPLSNTEDTWTASVPAGTEHLRVTLNGINGSDFDLYVRFGAPPTDETWDCGPNRDGHVEVCDFPTPAAGTWYARIKRFDGVAALYQTTLTVFGPVPPIFSDGFEAGSASAWSKNVP
ncbi:MAG TPA: trypsin-like serine protease [Thermoanaerobaculia bacterium]|nr:trypsin-like serine protease [Thermoanaerobaculia bacterium]